MPARPQSDRSRAALAAMRGVDVSKHPEAYRVGRGEEGVLTVEPYKSELLPLWRFRTPDVARRSSAALYARFREYRDAGDFVGMDMARKFLQMGWTRARRYANHPSGRKYDAAGDEIPRGDDPGKAEAARIFYRLYVKAREDPVYRRMRGQWSKSRTGRRR